MIVFDKPFARIVYHPQKQYLEQTFIGFASSEQFRSAMDVTVTFAKKQPVRAVIANTLKQAVVKQEDTDYAASVVPTLIQHGLQYMAFVVPESVFAQISVDRFKQNTESEMVHYFDKVDKAIQWVEEKL